MGTSADVLLAWFGDPARDRDDLERDMRRWQAGGEAEAARLAGFRPDVERALAGTSTPGPIPGAAGSRWSSSIS